MNILFLAQILPYPPDAGPKVKTWNVLRYLASCGHKITFVSFVRPDEIPHIPALQEYCVSIHTIPIRRIRLLEPWYFLKSLLDRRPFLVERDDRKDLRNVISRILSEKQIDVIHADQLSMAQFALGQVDCNSHRPYLIFDAHNAVWKIFDRMAQTMPFFLKPFFRFEAQRMKKYEGELVRSFDATMAVSDIDSRLLQEAYTSVGGRPEERPISVIPIAVDTQQIRSIRRQAGSLNILTLGTLHYSPNADGIRWFIHEVFPLIKKRIPKATLTIIGKNPPLDFQELNTRDPQTFHVTGYVPDLTDWLEKSAVVVIPVRIGGGMRVRILEAFARAMPVVTTQVGLEGIEARSGEEVLVADEPEAFANHVVEILDHPHLADLLAENGRRLAIMVYDWKVVLKSIADVYSAIENQVKEKYYVVS
jgi:glycosyltransferase involved in cell wall biosynthesis